MEHEYGKYRNYAEVFEYANSVVSTRKVACIEQRQACQRFLADMDHEGYELRPKDAEFVIGIIEETFIHVKGPLKGMPFLLEPWEKFIVYNVAGFYLIGTNERRYKEAFIFIPRKNGKTPFASALAWALSLLDRRHGSNLYIVGSSLKQAMETFNIILKNIKAMGEDGEFRILDNNSEHSMARSFYDDDENEIASMRIEALASNPDHADGLNANIVICDEIHAYKNANQYFVYKQAMKAYVNKLLIGITTAGKNMNSFCYQRLLYCQKILAGTVEANDYFIFICKADDPDDYTNPVEHEKANPNFRVTIRPQDVMSESLEAQNDPSSRNEFLNKSLNIYTNVATAYFDIYEVQTSDEKYSWTMEELAKLPITWFGGADLSKQYDLTGACLYGEYKDVAITVTHGFIPVTQAQKKADEDNIPFFWWQEQKWLTMCNSELVDYEEVVKWFIGMRTKGFKIKEVGYDKYNGREFVASMKKAKFKVAIVDQQYWKKSEAFRELERKIKALKFYYCHSAAFEYCISNVKAVEDSAERVKFEKVAPEQRIDLFDVTVIACKQSIIAKEKSSGRGDWYS